MHSKLIGFAFLSPSFRPFIAAGALALLAIPLVWWAWAACTKRGSLIMLVCAFVLMRVAAGFVISTLPTSVFAGGNPAFVNRKGPVLQIGGWFDAYMVRQVTMKISDLPVSTVVLASPGGSKEAADEIVSLLSGYQPTTVLPPDKLCISSCVRVFSGLGDPQIAGQGVLGFHAGRDSSGRQLPGAEAGVMENWANDLSPALGSYMRTCKRSPFLRSELFLITLDDVKKAITGTPVRLCDEQSRMVSSSVLIIDGASAGIQSDEPAEPSKNQPAH